MEVLKKTPIVVFFKILHQKFTTVSQTNEGPESTTIARDRSLQSTKEKYRLLIKEQVFLELFVMGFEEPNFSFFKVSVIWRNEHNFSIIWPKKSSTTGIICYYYQDNL